MSESEIPPADSVGEAERQRRRRHRRAFTLALLILAAIPTLLQIEPRRGARLDTVRVIGPTDPVAGSASGPRGRAPYRPAAVATPPYFGGLREAPPSELELRSALGPNRVLSASDAPVLAADPSAAFEPSDTTNPIQPAAFTTPGDGGPAATFPPLTATSTPPVVIGPVTTPSTPDNPPVTGPTTTTPPVVVSPPTTTNPTTPTNPTPPTTPPVDGGNPVVSPPTPDGPPVVVVTTPTDPGAPGTPPITDDPGGFQPGGGPPIDVTGVPEPSTWVELIAGFGLAGGLLRRRRQPPTTFLARSSALLAASRLG